MCYRTHRKSEQALCPGSGLHVSVCWACQAATCGGKNACSTGPVLFKEHLQSVTGYDCSPMAVAMSTTMLMHSRPCLSQTSLGLFSRLQHSPQGSPRSMFQAEGASAVPF